MGFILSLPYRHIMCSVHIYPPITDLPSLCALENSSCLSGTPFLYLKMS